MKKSVKHAIIIAVVIVLAFLWHSAVQPWKVLERAGVLWSVEQQMEDMLYRRPVGTDKSIKIIGVDEKTLNTYGKFENWSREKLAELIEVLTKDPEWAPAVIALDFLLVSDSKDNPETDARLAEAAGKAGNVVVASNLIYSTVFETDEDGTITSNEWHIEQVELPYEGLKEAATVGFTDPLQDPDGYIRRVRSFAYHEEEIQRSFAYQTYAAAMEAREKTVQEADAIIQFQYSGAPGEYEMVSLVDVLNGNVDTRGFKNSIVMVGAYASGMQDSLHVAVDHGKQMFGVEVHANITDALLNGKLVREVPAVIACAVAVLLLAGYTFVALRQKKLLYILTEGIGIIVCWLAAGLILKTKGWLLPLSVVIFGAILIMVYFVITKYVLERLEKKRVLKAFERYVAPEIVKELGKDEAFESRLGGERRDIAVLFVDIRGFTTMSESLEPEQVVDILNEYLELTSQSIFNNQGTLDKFIGDATMAVFNAPVDLEDYVYKAVCAAYDMKKGAEVLEKQLVERFGNSVQFGIGVNCGPAIVGNIGSVKRMDYTAIGDTVNTAARLESNAKRGEILISEAVYERIKERIEAEPVGELALKGKATKILTYRLLNIK